MTPERRSLITHLLKTHSPRHVANLLETSVSGERTNYSQIDTIRRSMAREQPLPPRDRVTQRPGPMLKSNDAGEPDRHASTYRTSCALNCEALERATIALFKRRAAQTGEDWAMLGARLHAGAV